jgi:hypothetical protein
LPSLQEGRVCHCGQGNLVTEGVAMKKCLVGLTTVVLAVISLGCSRELSESELKKEEEKMQQLETDLTKELPAKID